MNGKRLTKLRHEKGFTQAELAQQLGLGQNQISRYESDNYNPSVETLIRIVKALDTSSDYLLGLSNKPHPDAEPEPKLTPIEHEVISLINRFDESLQPSLIEAFKAIVRVLDEFNQQRK